METSVMNNSEHELVHIVPMNLLVGVFLALSFLTVLTVAAIKIDVGDLNIVIALVIATVKAALVVMYFMHLRWDGGFNRLLFLGTIVFLLLFLGFALMDTFEYHDTIEWTEKVLQ